MSSAPVIFTYLSAMSEHKASDLYLTAGYPPVLRRDTDMITLADEPLSTDDLNEILSNILSNRQKREYSSAMELNTSLDMGKHGRFRINVMRQRQTPALVIRRIESNIPNFKDLHLPLVLENLAMEKRGLVLVTGMTGSGKTTTLAAMVDHRNAHTKGHIITIEDPIEFFHEHKESVITQREVGVDTESFATAMKNALRQRPDVILVGEIRDRDVMEQAMAISETGHLCLATIHTNNAYQAIERIVNMFPEEQAGQVRLNLSLNLRAIISQRLLPSTQGGLKPAIEVMLNQGLVKELILKGEIAKIQDVMAQNNNSGMCTFDQSMLRLYMQGLITEETAITNSDKPTDLKIMIKQAKMAEKDGGSGESSLANLDTSRLSFSD